MAAASATTSMFGGGASSAFGVAPTPTMTGAGTSGTGSLGSKRGIFGAGASSCDKAQIDTDALAFCRKQKEDGLAVFGGGAGVTIHYDTHVYSAKVDKDCNVVDAICHSPSHEGESEPPWGPTWEEVQEELGRLYPEIVHSRDLREDEFNPWMTATECKPTTPEQEKICEDECKNGNDDKKCVSICSNKYRKSANKCVLTVVCDECINTPKFLAEF